MKAVKKLQNYLSILAFASMIIFFLSMASTTKEEVATVNEKEVGWNDYCGLGEIKMFAGNFAPRNWLLCDGQMLPISSNQALFSILGTTYGGDGRTTFRLPELRGRVPMHAGTGPGLSARPLGQVGGIENNHLTTPQLPAHNHTASVQGKVKINASINVPDHSTPDGTFMTDTKDKTYSSTATPNIFMGDTDMSDVSVTTGQTGSNQPINNLQPYITVNYIICISGDFPNRS